MSHNLPEFEKYLNYRFHQSLARYINSGCLRRRDVVISFFSSALLFFLNAKRVLEMYNNRSKSIKKESKKNERKNVCLYEITLEPFPNSDPGINALRNFLLDTLNRDLCGAYIHGSMAVDEKINYSDVDALVIIKDEAFQKTSRLARVSYKLNKALTYFHKIDPLQHHGWFVLTESDLRDYPQTYFPWELFKHAKSLFPAKGLDIKLTFVPGIQDYKTPYMDLALGIRWQLENGRYPGNMYQLKGLLSRFMLLPVLYCQARDRKGIFKKFSFDAARKDFPASAWAIMDEVSAIRSAWHYSLDHLRRFLMTRRSPLWIRLKRRIGPRIPPGLKRKLSSGFYQRMLDLIEQMEEKLYEIQVH